MGLRRLTGDELPEVVEIEATLHPTPWNAAQFADSVTGGHDLWAWDEDSGGGLAGYAVTLQVLDEAHLLNLSVRQERQRSGIGRALLSGVLDAASTRGAVRMFLEVRASNSAARALYHACGFVEIGRRKSYYALPEGAREDAVVMVREMSAHG